MAPESERAHRDTSCIPCGWKDSCNELCECPCHYSGCPGCGSPVPTQRNYVSLIRWTPGNLCKHPWHDKQPKPNEPTLTCSEVVERLPGVCGKQMTQWNPGTGAMYCNSAPGHEGSCSYTFFFNNNTPHPPATDSWRERRVQELEEALRLCMDVIWTEFHCGDGQIGSPGSDEEIAYKTAQKLLANSEQIRKGAEHE